MALDTCFRCGGPIEGFQPRELVNNYTPVNSGGPPPSEQQLHRRGIDCWMWLNSHCGDEHEHVDGESIQCSKPQGHANSHGTTTPDGTLVTWWTVSA